MNRELNDKTMDFYQIMTFEETNPQPVKGQIVARWHGPNMMTDVFIEDPDHGFVTSYILLWFKKLEDCPLIEGKYTC